MENLKKITIFKAIILKDFIVDLQKLKIKIKSLKISDTGD